MTLPNLPKMIFSEREGWQDLIRMHPSVARLFALFVLPMSLIPPAMFIYSSVAHPGRIFPELAPPLSTFEMLAVALVFLLAELAMVALMGSMIRQMGEIIDVSPPYEDAVLLAAVAPTPLWLCPLALFIPSLWVNGLALAAAWVASAALIYHGVYPLFRPETPKRAHLMALFVLGVGVMAWIALMVVLVMLLSILMQWR